MEARGNAQVITCQVPLSEMFGYATDLRSLSQGRASYTHAVRRLRAGAEERQRRDRGQGRRLSRHRDRNEIKNRGETHGQGKIRSFEAARQRRDDRSRRPRQDDPDGGDHEGSGHEGPGEFRGLRPDRQGAGRARARHHDRDGARGVPDREAPLRARRLPGPRRLREEHDHRRGADGRRDPGGLGGRRPDAADAGAHPAGAPGGRAVDGGVHEQVRHGRRSGAARPGGAGGSRAAVDVRVPGRRHSDHPGLGAAGAGVGDGGQRVGRQDHRADGRGGQLHSAAGARDRQGLPDADRRHLLDLGPRHGGDGPGGARDREGGRGSARSWASVRRRRRS